MYWQNKLNMAARRVAPNSRLFTEDMFFEYMPQFQKEEVKEVNGKQIKERISLIPQKALETFLDMANKNILEQRWYEKWEYACALYVAHYSLLYLRDYKEKSENIAEATEASPTGVVSSSSLGDASISYDNSMITQSLQKWGVWASTNYGQQLVNEARLIGMGGAFVI